MAKPATYTDDMIREACEALAESGQGVTNMAVYQQLGGGTFSRIGPIVREFKEHQGDRQELATVEHDSNELPASLTSPVIAALSAARDTIQAQANEAIASAERRAETAIRLAEQERDEARIEAGALNELIVDLEARIEDTEKATAKAKAQAAKAERKVVKLDKDLAVANGRLQVYDEMKAIKEARAAQGGPGAAKAAPATRQAQGGAKGARSGSGAAQ